jgi:GIY-YIG catalytic domain
VGVLQRIRLGLEIFTFFKLYIVYMLSKINSISEVIDRELLDNDLNDIDNKTLEIKFSELPTPKLPDPNKSQTKNILNKLKNIQAESQFIGIKESKIEILSNIKNKAGIYMFFNLVNGNTYIGSSVKLDRRFRVHMSSIGSVNLPLYNALNKYHLNNFFYLVLQYFDPIEEKCLGLEQSFLDLYKSKYNILKLAFSYQGFKHSPGTIAKLKKSHAGK